MEIKILRRVRAESARRLPRDRATGRRIVDVRPPGRRRRPAEAVEAPVDQRDRCEHASSSRSRISAPCGLGARASGQKATNSTTRRRRGTG